MDKVPPCQIYMEVKLHGGVNRKIKKIAEYKCDNRDAIVEFINRDGYKKSIYRRGLFSLGEWNSQLFYLIASSSHEKEFRLELKIKDLRRILIPE